MKLLMTIFLTGVLLTACGRQSERDASVDQSPQASQINQSCAGHQTGVSFPSADGCNTCSCNSSGQMLCSLIACGNLPGLDLSKYR